MSIHKIFGQAAKQALLSSKIQEKLASNAIKFKFDLDEALKQFSDIEAARNRAKYIKWRVNENLDKYLVDFEANLIRSGGKVIWAHDAATALSEIESILKKDGSKNIIKSKSAINDEIGLSEYLKKQNVNVIESDIGDFIMSQFDEKPFNSKQSAVHKTKQEVNDLMNLKIKSSLGIDISELVTDVREHLRKDLFEASVSICEANFLISDNGMVAICENEGNVLIANALVKKQIILAGIDMVLPSMHDVDLFFSLYGAYGSGQKLTTYNSIIGPKNNIELDGYHEFIVVLLDNGRSNVLASQDQREVLSCIQCGACNYVCPIYHSVGVNSLGLNDPNPVGFVKAPLAFGLKENKQLPKASLSCGNCNHVCPVKIDLTNHIIRNRRDAIKQSSETNTDKLAWYAWNKAMIDRKNLNGSFTIKKFTFGQLVGSSWGSDRVLPKLAPKSFNQLWREKMGAK
jgi:L-lactate dehydrogenase complex protein LldF